MDLSIRGHIISNFKDDNEDNLRKAIDESIKENDEVTLTLGFSNGEEQTIKVPVKTVMGGMMQQNGMKHGNMNHKCN